MLEKIKCNVRGMFKIKTISAFRVQKKKLESFTKIKTNKQEGKYEK